MQNHKIAEMPAVYTPCMMQSDSHYYNSIKVTHLTTDTYNV